jgi:hypothetical protein
VTTIKVDVLFGTKEVQARFRSDGERLIGEGRSITRNRDGGIVRISAWEPTGVVVTWPERKAPRRWWQFWRRA